MTPADRLQHAVVAFEAADLRSGYYPHIGEPCDAVDEVARHACREAWSPHQKPYFGDLARQVDRCLPRGVVHCPRFCTCTRARALWGLTRNLRKPRNTANPTPSLHF